MRRDAIVVRKANELSIELGIANRTPVVWDDNECIVLNTFEMSFPDKDKGYMWQDAPEDDLYNDRADISVLLLRPPRRFEPTPEGNDPKPRALEASA